MPLQNTAPHPPTKNKQKNKKVEPVEYPLYYPVKIIGLPCFIVLPWIYLPSEVRVRMTTIQIDRCGKVEFYSTLYHTPELKVSFPSQTLLAR